MSALRPPLRWFGGKRFLAHRIADIVQARLGPGYVEPCLGGGAVFLTLLDRGLLDRVVLGDLDDDLMHFWATLRHDGADLVEAALDVAIMDGRTAWDAFRRAQRRLVRAEGRDSWGVDRALAFWVANRLSRCGLADNYGWSERLRGGKPEYLNAWAGAVHGAGAVGEAMRGLGDRLEMRVGACWDTIRDNGGLVYVDPPYMHSARTHRKAYRHEMSYEQHALLLSVLREYAGDVLVSGYSTPLYERVLAGWDRREYQMKNHSGQGKLKQARTEVLWANFPMRDDNGR